MMIANLKTVFTAHPATVGETYLEHSRFAFRFSAKLLLAGLAAPGATQVTEPVMSRDHTERMLARMGADIASGPGRDGGWTVTLAGQPELAAIDVDVPAELVRYLNRLSDLLFIMARHQNRAAGGADVLWDTNV